MKAVKTYLKIYRPTSASYILNGLQAVIYIYLVLWIGFLPVLQAAHLLFADHDHRFCMEHGHLEDVPLVHGPVFSKILEKDTQGLWLATQPEAEARAHEACSILGCANFQGPLTNFDARSSTALLDENLASAYFAEESGGLRALWLFAPKTSPPSLFV